jgi:hypothetical protein
LSFVPLGIYKAVTLIISYEAASELTFDIEPFFSVAE